MTPQKFRTLVWAYYKKHGRHDLPWRKTTDPYRVLVSEVMLQQTQVERVRPYYDAWLTKYPNVHALAKAPLKDVLISWQGLGYNRRAKMLHEAAKEVSRTTKKLPTDVTALEALPGIGPYTARAVAAFAGNQDVIFIETNIRTAVIHHFYPRKKTISDREIYAVLEKSFPKGRAREWYAALMDYGSFLKRSGVKLNSRSTHYVKQKGFAGSDRQARGAILKELARGSATKAQLLGLLGDDRTEQMATQLARLQDEGLVARRAARYHLPA